MSYITLTGRLIPPLRTGLYSRLAIDADALTHACERPDRESSPQARHAYARLRQTAWLLARAGWTRPQPTLTLGSPRELEIARDALAIAIDASQTAADDARRRGNSDAFAAADADLQIATDALAALRASTDRQNDEGRA